MHLSDLAKQTAGCFYLTGDIYMCTVHTRNTRCGNPVALCLRYKKPKGTSVTEALKLFINIPGSLFACLVTRFIELL